MAILLSNDDGIDAPGLAALASALAGLDDLVVSAPAENKSGVSGAISLGKLLSAARVPDGPGGMPRFSVAGTPADAVKFGLQHGMGGARPRLVVSGINKGLNIGSSVRDSGTIGAAIEAAGSGIPAIAVSTDWGDAPNWSAAGHFARILAEKMLALPPDSGAFVLNLNVPSCDPGAVRGLVIARAGRSGYRDVMIPEGNDRYRLWAERVWAGAGSDCDGAAVEAGYAVATPLRVDMTDRALMARLCGAWDGVEAYRPQGGA